MRTFPLAVALSIGSTLAFAQNAGDPPAPAGCSYVAFHAYSECSGGDPQVWHVVTDGIYACNNGRAPGRQRVNDIPTTQLCAGPNKVKAPSPQSHLTVELQGCQAPAKDGDVIIQQCIERIWYNVKYLRYRCLDGTIRLDAAQYFSTGKACGDDTSEPPTLDPGNLGSPSAAPASTAAARLDFGQPAQFASVSLPRESSTQLMMLDILDVDVPGARSARAEPFPAIGSGLWSRLWHTLTHTTPPWAASYTAAPGLWLAPLGGGGGQGVTRGARVHAYLTSLGTSTGEAFDIQIVNDTTLPVHIGGDGVVVEPVKKGSDKALRAELQQVSTRAAGSTMVKANAYCLEFKLKPPERGTMFHVADESTQQKYTAAREILRASRKLQAAGQLEPDSEPRDYFHAIRQWTIWTDEQRFTLASYRDAFIARTKKNAEALGRKWSSQIEDGLKALVPHRWDEITKILRESGQPVPRG